MEEKKISNIEAIEGAIELLNGFLKQAKSGDPIRCQVDCHSVGIVPDPIATAQQDREVMMDLGGKYAVIMVTRPNVTVDSMLKHLHPLIEPV